MVHQYFLPVACVALLLGPATHLAFFIRSDLDSSSHNILLIANLVFIGGPIVLWLRGFPAWDAFTLSFAAKLGYVLSLYSSIALYRLFFHPLKRFPGPVGARISVFWKVRQILASDYKAYEVVDKVHGQYGEIVRIGPRQLSVNNASAIAQIYGATSKCERNHNLELVRKSLQSLANRDEHKARRSVWENGLSPKACQTYWSRMNAIANSMVRAFARKNGEPFVVNDWCHFYTYDLIGDLGFGKTYNQLETGQIHPSILKIHRFMRAGVIAVQMLWLVNIGQHIPGQDDPMRDLRQWAENLLAQRQRLRAADKGEVHEKDLMSYVYESKRQVDERWPMSDRDIAEDAVTLQIGGSDTSYSVLVHLFHYLATYQDLQQRIRTEILPTFEDEEAGSEPTWSKLGSAQVCPWLDAIVAEVLRLHPPVPLAMIRQTPSTHSVTIAGHEIPPDTIISCPTYTIQRDERNFARGDDFIPERWLDKSHPESKSEMILERKAFAPFSVGPMNCPGKYLAIMEIKLVVAKMLQSFEITFPGCKEDTTETREQRDYKLKETTKDFFTLWVGDVEVCMRAL